jgi:hypothetical protein
MSDVSFCATFTMMDLAYCVVTDQVEGTYSQTGSSEASRVMLNTRNLTKSPLTQLPHLFQGSNEHS